MYPTSFRSILGTAGLAAALITPIPCASQVQVQRLERADAAFPEPFTSVAGLRELSDGRILIADRTEKHVSFIDFATGSMRQIGRVGEGPGEYQSPGGLVAMPDDYTLLLDLSNLRLTRIAPDGKLDMESWPMLSGNGLLRPTATDAQGRFIYSAAGGLRISLGGGSSGPPTDSLPILRWDPETDVTDTVATFYSPSATGGGGGTITRRSGSSGGFSLAGFRRQPFLARDAWAALPDGSIAVGRATEYRVDRYQHGVSTAGPTVEYDPIRINKDEKEAWADGQANQTATFVAIGGGGGGGGGGTFQTPRPDIDDVDFPDYKPPFPNTGVRATPDGQIWVQRYQRHDEDRALYDVFNEHGALVKQVLLPADRRLIGFGDGVLYAVVTDEDDLQWLERYALLTATRDAAVLLDVDSIGTVEAGSVADFVVLTADPLQDIGNAKAIDFIVFKGVRYFPEDLGR